MCRIVDDGGWRNKEVAVVGYLVFHETTMLEVGVERFLPFQLPMMESQHKEFVVNMLKDNTLPSSCQTVEMVRLLGLGGIVEGPFQPAVVRAAVAPLVAAPVVAIFIEKSNLAGGEGILKVLIPLNLLHEVRVRLVVIVE